MPQVVEGNRPRQLFYKGRTLRTRADKTHVASQDVEKLGQFINTAPPDDFTDRGDAAIKQNHQKNNQPAGNRFGL